MVMTIVKSFFREFCTLDAFSESTVVVREVATCPMNPFIMRCNLEFRKFPFITWEVKFLMRSVKLYRVQSCHTEIKQEVLTIGCP